MKSNEHRCLCAACVLYTTSTRIQPLSPYPSTCWNTPVNFLLDMHSRLRAATQPSGSFSTVGGAWANGGGGRRKQ